MYVVHELGAKEDLQLKRIEVSQQILELKSMEQKVTYSHQCKRMCYIDHNRFNYTTKKSSLYIKKLNSISKRNIFGNAESVRKNCDLTFFNKFASTQ